MKLTDKEKNYIKSRILNKRWKAGSMDVNKRRAFLQDLLQKGLIDEGANLTKKATDLYHEQL